MEKPLTWHRDKDFKNALIKEMEKHRQMDLMIKGSYNSNEKAFCAVGCSVHSLKAIGKNGMKYDDHNALKEWLIKASGPEEWMKHIE